MVTAVQKKPDHPYGHLSDAAVDDLGRELDAIREAVLESRGASDARYIRRVIRVQRSLELGSRVC
jgi:linoleoyl-CoA desaturase